jgi:hypothetical protein
MAERCAREERSAFCNSPNKREMDKPLRHHISELERRVERLSRQMMQEHKTLEERNRMEAELRVAQQALEHYQHAIKLEGKLETS